MSRLAITALALLLTACATKEGARISNTAATPLRDLNLSPSVIPALLSDARKRPYMMPLDSSCKALSLEIKKLDEVLGPDIDVPVVEPGGSDAVSEAVGNAFQSMVEGAVPFRHWIRKLSGAEQHASEVSAANAAGSARRAFLKGIKMINACPETTENRIAGPLP